MKLSMLVYHHDLEYRVKSIGSYQVQVTVWAERKIAERKKLLHQSTNFVFGGNWDMYSWLTDIGIETIM